MSLLEGIQSPEDLKRLRRDQLPELAQDVRDRLIQCVSVTGGHIGASLGCVELAIALLYDFDSPTDKILWDVGLQAYAWKLLTGRNQSFRTLRTKGGISGFIRLENELKGLSERTLRGEEFRAFLRHLARESDPLQMKVISITPSEEKFSPSEEKKGTALQDSRKVMVHLVLHSTFAKLESYLKGIEELPFLVQIEGLQIQRTYEIQPLLKVTLGLKMYIIAL